MKKETVLLVVVVLIAGILIGVIVSNMHKDKGRPSPAPGSTPAAIVDHQQRITTLEEIVAKEPKNRNAWVQLGHNFFDSDQPMKAIDAYDKALALDGRDPDVLTDQGIMFRRVGWYDRAIANFIKANEVSPGHQQSLYNLGIVYRYDLKDFAKAAQAWERLLELDPNGPNASQLKAEVEFLKTHAQLAQPQQ